MSIFPDQKPWSKSGVDVVSGLSAQEAMIAAGLNWSVEKVPLHYYPKPGQDSQTVRNSVGIMRVDNGSILGITSHKYEPYDNLSGFEAFQGILDTGMAKIESVGSFKGGKIVWALARIEHEDMAVDSQDLIRPFVLLSFSHDGKMGVRAGFIPIRILCLNTLAAAFSHGLSRLIRVSHKGDVKGNVNQLISIMDLTVQEFRASVADYRKMLDTPINQADLREYVRVSLQLEEKENNKKASNIIDNAVQLATTGKGNAPYAGTVWAAYNGITELLSYNAGRNADNRMSSLWFGNNKLTLQRAHEEAMAIVAKAA